MLHEYATDGHRFTLSFFDVIQASAAHIYHSALPLVPKTTFWESYAKRECGHEARVLQGHDQQWRSLMRIVSVSGLPSAIEYSRNGSILAVVGNGFSHLYHSVTGGRRAELEADCGLVQSVSFSCNDQTLATSSLDSIHLWDVSTGSRIAKLDIDEAFYHNVAFHPHIEHVLIAYRNSHIYIWDVRDASHRTAFKVGMSFAGVCWLRRSNLKRVIVGRASGEVEMWDVDTRQQIRLFPPPSSDHPGVWAVASSHDGSLVASSSSGGALVYNADTGDVVHSFQPGGLIYSLAFSPTEPLLAIGSTKAPYAELLYLDREHMVSLDHHTSVRSVAFSPDGRFVASASYNHTINIWGTNATDITPASHNEHHLEYIMRAHFSPNGEYVVSTAWKDTAVKIGDARTGALCTTLDGHKADVLNAAILSDNVHVVSVDRIGTLTLWNWQQGKILCDNRALSINDHYPFIVPYSHHVRIPGLVSFHQDKSNGRETVCCWTIEPRHPDGARIVPVAREVIDTNSSIAQISHRGSAETQDFMLVLEYCSGEQFSALWSNPSVVPEQPDELRFVKGPEQSPFKGAPQHFAWEMPSDQSEDDAWILNKHRERIMWIPPVNRGHGRWYGRKLVIAGLSGRLTLVDFSDVNEDSDFF